MLKHVVGSILRRKYKHHLHVDSKALFDTVTTLHEGTDYRLRQTVQRIRDSFECGDLDVLCWIPGNANIADALTKRNTVLYRLLNKIAITGVYPRLAQHYQLDSLTWK